MELIKKYFPELSEKQFSQFENLFDLYKDWNSKINVISRKDIDNLYLHHVLHSMAIAKYISFKPNTSVLDLGTGGGFPGVPLAILFPEVNFHLVDSINKKLTVVQEVANGIGLTNITTQHTRVEDIKKKQYDFVVTRAVANLKQIFSWSRKHISNSHHNLMPNGIIALKGGNLKAEIKEMPRGEYVEKVKISGYFDEDFFVDKYVVYVQG